MSVYKYLNSKMAVIVSKIDFKVPSFPQSVSGNPLLKTWMPDYNLGHDEKNYFHVPL